MMRSRAIVVELPERESTEVSSPLLIEALEAGKLAAPLAEALSGLSDRFLEEAGGGARSGPVGEGALLVLAVSRACQEMGTDRLKVCSADILRWCRCMAFLLNVERLRRTGVIQSVWAGPISEPDSVVTFS
jgi:hypothetical protein